MTGLLPVKYILEYEIVKMEKCFIAKEGEGGIIAVAIKSYFLPASTAASRLASS